MVQGGEGAAEESQPVLSGAESEPDISDIGGDSKQTSDHTKQKHRLASSSRPDDHSSKPARLVATSVGSKEARAG